MTDIDEDERLDRPADQRPLYPYFGSKRRITHEIWQGIGKVNNWVEPFCGTCSVTMARPGGAYGVETVNDANHFISNFWRALQHEPDAVAEHASWIVSEVDLEARHAWLMSSGKRTLEAIMPDPGSCVGSVQCAATRSKDCQRRR